MDITTVGVVGAGVMGSDIAYVSALGERRVLLCDVDDDMLGRGWARIDDLAGRAVARGQLTPELAAQLRARITTTTALADLAPCDLAIEAVSERLDLKRTIFGQLDAILAPGALLASNTSGLSISALAEATGRAEAVLGVHFFNPAAVMKLVELIQGRRTAPDTIARADAFVRSLGKVPVRVRECPGFLVNRILVRAMVEAYRHATESGVDPGAADAAVVEGGPAPMGPFALGDLIGLDTMDHIQRDLEDAYGERFLDAGAIGAQVAHGRLGRKTGGGFLDGATPQAGVDDAARAVAQRYYLGALNEALRCHQEEIAARADIDLAMRLGAGWSAGPLEWADALGVPGVTGAMQELAARAGNRFQPTAYMRACADAARPLRDDADPTPGPSAP